MSHDPPETDAMFERSVAEEIRYSLRDLLKEVEAERQLSDFAREAVDQEEISKMFKRRRASQRKQDGRA
ncbi:MAG: hypothetical protein ACLFR7_05365 [Opitutales bacterium]